MLSGADPQCPLCSQPCGGGGADWGYWFVCDTCGRFNIALEVSGAIDGLTVTQRSWLSHFARTKWDYCEAWRKTVRDDTPEPTPTMIDSKLVERARNGDLAVTRAQQAANAIRHIGDRSP